MLDFLFQDHNLFYMIQAPFQMICIQLYQKNMSCQNYTCSFSLWKWYNHHFLKPTIFQAPFKMSNECQQCQFYTQSLIWVCYYAIKNILAAFKSPWRIFFATNSFIKEARRFMILRANVVFPTPSRKNGDP